MRGRGPAAFVPAHVKKRVEQWLRAGASFRVVQAEFKLAKQTVQRIKDRMDEKSDGRRPLKEGFPILRGSGPRGGRRFIASYQEARTVLLEPDGPGLYQVTLLRWPAKLTERWPGLSPDDAIVTFVRCYHGDSE